MNIKGAAGRLGLAALAGALALMLVGATAAQAELTKVTGSTTVTPSPQAVQFLTNNGVSVETDRRSQRRQRQLHLPDRGGLR